MTRKTRERIEDIENRLFDLCAAENRIIALEDSLEAAELKIEQRKQENVYLNRLLDMLQHGIVQKVGEAPADTPPAEEKGNSWSE